MQVGPKDAPTPRGQGKRTTCVEKSLSRARLVRIRVPGHSHEMQVAGGPRRGPRMGGFQRA